MTEETNTTPSQEAYVNPVDEIASLLTGDEESESETETEAELSPDTADIEEDDDTEESTQEDDEEDESESEEVDEDAQAVLAEAFGIDANQISVSEEGSVQVSIKVDGEQTTLPMKDLIRGYQTDKSNTHKSQALAQEKKQFEGFAQNQAQQLRETLEQNVALTDVLKNELMREYEGVNWTELRDFDPAEYAAKRQDYASRNGRIEQLQGQLANDRQQGIKEQQEKYQSANQQALRAQYSVMMEKNPTWSQPETFDKVMSEFRTFGNDAYGFNETEMRDIQDARIFEVLKDAMAYRNGKSVAAKKLKKVPKLQKSTGPRKRKKVSKLDKLTRAAKGASGSHKRDLQTEAVTQLLMGG
jgi:hypothetical protein